MALGFAQEQRRRDGADQDVIGTRFQTVDLKADGICAGQHEDGGVGFGAKLAAEFDGETVVEFIPHDIDLGAPTFQFPPRFLGSRHPARLEAFMLQGFLTDARHRLIAFDD
jgi:hypothetical protein